MSEVFWGLLRVALIATAVMVVVMVLRVALPGLSKRARCALWGLVAVALTVPLIFQPTSPFSMMPESLSNGNLWEGLGNEPGETPYYDTYGDDLLLSDGQALVEDSGHHAATGSEDISAPQTVQGVAKPLLAWTWFAVMTGMVLYALVSFWRLRQNMGDAASTDGNIYYGENVATPFILGVFRPRIYLPAGMDEAETRMVLAHEKAHLQRGDHIWKMVGYALLSVYWFHPLCWVCYRLFCRDIELACDEKVVRDFAPEQRADYSQTLLMCSAPEKFALTCPLAFGEVGVKERVISILNYKKPTFWVSVVAVVACIVAAVLFLTVPASDGDGHAYVVGVNIEGYSAQDFTDNFPTESDAVVLHDRNGIPATIRLIDKKGNVVRSITSEGSGTTTLYQLQPGEITDLEVVTEAFYVGELNYLCHGDRDCDETCVEFATLYQTGNVTPNVVKLEEADIGNYEKLKNGEITLYDMAVSLGVYPQMMERYSQIYCDAEGHCTISKGASHEMAAVTPPDFAYLLKATGKNAITPDSLAVYDGEGNLQEVYTDFSQSQEGSGDNDTAALLERMKNGETTMYAANMEAGRYPTYMQPYTEIICDGDLNCTIATGGELTYEEIINRNDILGVGLIGGPLEPNTKITYDLHGFIQNIYYEIPGKPGEYQLSPPSPAQQQGALSSPDAVISEALKAPEELAKLEIQLGDDFLFAVDDHEKLVKLGEMFANAVEIPYRPQTLTLDVTLYFVYDDNSITAVPVDLRKNVYWLDGTYYNFAFRENGENLTDLTYETMRELLEMDTWDETVGDYERYGDFFWGF